jgi:hypothetical protein
MRGGTGRLPGRDDERDPDLYKFLLYRMSQKNRKLLKSLIVKIECPTKKLNIMMRKILTRCMY